MSRIFRTIHNTKPALPIKTSSVRAEIIAAEPGSNWSLVFSADVPSSISFNPPYRATVSCRYVASSSRKKCLLVAASTSNGDMKPLMLAAKHPTAKTRFRVSCTCMEYLHTYMRPNHEHDYHYGSLEKLPKPKGTGAPRNPKHLTGCCYHIALVRNALMDLGYIQQ